MLEQGVVTLHYFALDSAEWWERILGELLPNAQFPDAVVRRTIAYKMFTAVHIAPSHRRHLIMGTVTCSSYC